MRVENSDQVVEQVEVARAFQPMPNDMVICPAAVHISTDPVTGTIQVAVFTDDGRGNGDHIITVYLSQ